MNLHDLSLPFASGDVEWRVSRAGVGKGGVYCYVLAYVTARAIQQRLDDVCGPDNWCNTPMETHEVRPGAIAVQVGISIRVRDEWITKYDVAEATSIEPAKGGFSGAMKRAAAVWSLARYLYHLTEAVAEVSDGRQQGWHYATLPKQDNRVYYWKPPALPAWALPKEREAEVSAGALNGLKNDWRAKFAGDVDNRAELAEAFERYVVSTVGVFPISDHTCWTQGALKKCQSKIEQATDSSAISADVPFEGVDP